MAGPTLRWAHIKFQICEADGLISR